MLLRNVDAYKEQATAVSATYWQLVRNALSKCRIFFSTPLEHPYDLLQKRYLVSLSGSADYSNRRLVGNTLPVIHSATGDAHQLRLKLKAPSHLELHHIAEHLTNTAEAVCLQSRSQQSKLSQQLSQDVHAAYVQIVNQAAECLQQGSTTTPRFRSATELLRDRPWVLTQSEPLVFRRPNELCYHHGVDANNGEVTAHASFPVVTVHASFPECFA